MSASRSVSWTVTNGTSNAWTLVSSDLNHGILGNNPPKSIGPGQTASFSAESNGLMTGCEGTVTYASDDGSFAFYFDNPYIGGDDYKVTTPNDFDQKTSQQTGNDYVLNTKCFKIS